jgi:hypothetical protein
MIEDSVSPRKDQRSSLCFQCRRASEVYLSTLQMSTPADLGPVCAAATTLPPPALQHVADAFFPLVALPVVLLASITEA